MVLHKHLVSVYAGLRPRLAVGDPLGGLTPHSESKGALMWDSLSESVNMIGRIGALQQEREAV
jgi:hypothetical protein